MAGPKGPLLCLALCLKDAQIFSLAMKKKWLKGLYQLHAVPARRNLSPSCLCYTALSFGTVGPQSRRNEAVGSGVRGLRGASRVRGWRQGLVLGVCLLWQWCPELRRAVTWPHLPCAPGERPRPFSWLGSGPVELS